MKRTLLLVTMASMLAAAMALSGVAQAAPISGKADAQCAKLAIKTLGPSFNPSNYTFIGGTEGNDNLTGRATDVPDVICGFGGRDLIAGALEAGDIFLGGEGNDAVWYNSGTFYGQEGIDEGSTNLSGGTFYGGADFDFVVNNDIGATFYGEESRDQVEYNSGTFYGGAGNDFVFTNEGGATFYGEEGDDEVFINNGDFLPGPDG